MEDRAELVEEGGCGDGEGDRLGWVRLEVGSAVWAERGCEEDRGGCNGRVEGQLVNGRRTRGRKAASDA